jgi:hypothetical protein
LREGVKSAFGGVIWVICILCACFEMFGSTMMMNDCLVVVSSDDCHVSYILSFDFLCLNKRKHAYLGVTYIYEIAYRICHDLQHRIDNYINGSLSFF